MSYPPTKRIARRQFGRWKANKKQGKSQAKGRKWQLSTIAEYFTDPSSLSNPDDQRIYRLLVESGFPTPPPQLELGERSCSFKETPLASWMRRERAKADGK